eukprot:jgi/Ulvmu1/11708/UM008_0119.1
MSSTVQPRPSLAEQPSMPSSERQGQLATDALPLLPADSVPAPEIVRLRSDVPVPVRKALRARQKWDDPFSLLYPPDARLVTQEHLNTLRQLAEERDKNRDTAKYALLNVQFGVNALASYLAGDVKLQSYASVSTRRAVEVRQRWTKAIKMVIHRNRFVYGTKDLCRARKLQHKGLILGYMITNFNHLSFERGNVLELMLDWFDSYTRMSETPAKHLSGVLAAERQRHHEKQLKAEQHNRGIDKVIAADRVLTGGDMDIVARPQKLFVAPWDPIMAADTVKATSRRYKALKGIAKLGQGIGSCNERIGSKARQLMSIADSTMSDPESSNLQLEQARTALSIHLQGCQTLAVSLDAAVSALTDPTAQSMADEQRAARAEGQAAKARAMNTVLHEEIRQLQQQVEAAQEDEGRRQTVHRKQTEALQVKIAELQLELDVQRRAVDDMQTRQHTLQDDKRRLEDIIASFGDANETAKTMAFSIRELEHKNAGLRERLQSMQQLREALARAQERLEDSEAVTRDAHAARAEATALRDTVRELEARLRGAEADKEAAVYGLRAEIGRCKQEAATAMEAAGAAVASQLCEAAEQAADTATAKLQPLQTLHSQGVADGEASEPQHAADALGEIMQALQLTFSELLGPLRNTKGSSAARNALWRVTDAVHAAGKSVAALEFGRGKQAGASVEAELQAALAAAQHAVTRSVTAVLESAAAVQPIAVAAIGSVGGDARGGTVEQDQLASPEAGAQLHSESSTDDAVKPDNAPGSPESPAEALAAGAEGDAAAQSLHEAAAVSESPGEGRAMAPSGRHTAHWAACIRSGSGVAATGGAAGPAADAARLLQQLQGTLRFWEDVSGVMVAGLADVGAGGKDVDGAVEAERDRLEGSLQQRRQEAQGIVADLEGFLAARARPPSPKDAVAMWNPPSRWSTVSHGGHLADILSTPSMGSSRKSAGPGDLQDLIMQSACTLLRHPQASPDRLSTLLDTFTRLLAPAAAGSASPDGRVLMEGLAEAHAPAPAEGLASAALEQFGAMLAGAEERLEGEDDAAQVAAVLREVLLRGTLALEDMQKMHQQALEVLRPPEAEHVSRSPQAVDVARPLGQMPRQDTAVAGPGECARPDERASLASSVRHNSIASEAAALADTSAEALAAAEAAAVKAHAEVAQMQQKLEAERAEHERTGAALREAQQEVAEARSAAAAAAQRAASDIAAAASSLAAREAAMYMELQDLREAAAPPAAAVTAGTMVAPTGAAVEAEVVTTSEAVATPEAEAAAALAASTGRGESKEAAEALQQEIAAMASGGSGGSDAAAQPSSPAELANVLSHAPTAEGTSFGGANGRQTSDASPTPAAAPSAAQLASATLESLARSSSTGAAAVMTARAEAAEASLAQLARSTLAALEVALGQLPLSPADITPDVIAALTEDLRTAAAACPPANPPAPYIDSAAHSASATASPRSFTAMPRVSSSPSEAVEAAADPSDMDQQSAVAAHSLSTEAEEPDGSMHGEHEYRAVDVRPSVTWRSGVAALSGLDGPIVGEREAAADEVELVLDDKGTGQGRLGSARADDWQHEALGVEEEVSLVGGLPVLPLRARAKSAGEKRVKYASSFEFVDAASAQPRGGGSGCQRSGVAGLAPAGVQREALDRRMRRHREELRHVAAMAAAAAVAAGRKGAAGGVYGVSFDAALRALTASSRGAAQRVKEEGLRGGAPGRKDWATAGWVAGAARGAETEGLQMVQHAPGCPALPWKLVHPGSRLPEQLARRAAAVAQNATPETQGSTAPTGATTVDKVSSAPPPSRSFAALHDPTPGSMLQLLWIREATTGVAPAAFSRMRAELAQLNALYARALQQAATLMSARAVGAVSDGAVASLQAVEASSVGATMAAMDTLNDLEPLRALPQARPTRSIEAAGGPADEASETDAIYARLHADAAQWMAGLQGTPLLARNRAAFDRTLRARAAAAAAAQAAAEARLSQTQRVERCSAFVPEPAALDCASSCKAGAPRRAHAHFRHTAVFRSLFDQKIIPTPARAATAAAAPVTPPLRVSTGPLTPPPSSQGPRHGTQPPEDEPLGMCTTTPDSQGDPVLYSGFPTLLEGDSSGRLGGGEELLPRNPHAHGETMLVERRPGESGVAGKVAAGKLQKPAAGGHLTVELLGIQVNARVAGGSRLARPRVITAPKVARHTAHAAALQVARSGGSAEKLRRLAQRAADRRSGGDAVGAACALGRAVSPSGRSAVEADAPAGHGGSLEVERLELGRRQESRLRHQDVVAAAAAVAQR